MGGWCCRNKVLGVAIACSNTFGLVTGAFLLGFGLVEIPRSMWRNADLQYRQKVLSHKIAKAAVKLDDAHQELSTAIVVHTHTHTLSLSLVAVMLYPRPYVLYSAFLVHKFGVVCSSIQT